MNTSAIVMMIISMLFLWGGLALSILHLMKNPEDLDDVLEDVKDQHTLLSHCPERPAELHARLSAGAGKAVHSGAYSSDSTGIYSR